MNDDILPFATTITVRDTCLCFHAQKTARILGRHYDAALRPHGLTNGQFSLLMSLNRPEAPPLSAVAETLGMDRTTLTAMLKPLVRRGLAEVVAGREDRRSRLIQLTRSGRETLAAALPAWRAAQDRLSARLGEDGAGLVRAGMGEIAGRVLEGERPVG